MSEEVISEFIAQCASIGISEPEAISEHALNKIREIDVIILAADKLRHERAQMLEVIKSFGFETPKPARRVVPTLNENSTQDDLDAKSLNNVIKICNHLEINSSSSIRELMTVLSLTPQNDVDLYTVIKWLCSAGICARTSDRTVIQGPNWNNRPKGD